MSRSQLGRLLAVLLLLIAALGTPTAAAAEQPVITLTFVRHAESLGNASGFIDTSTPGPPLSALGWVQAYSEAPALAAAGFDGIYASTMIRTQQTAQPLSQLLDEPVGVLAGLREIEAGEFEGQPEASALDNALDTALDTGAVGYFTAPEQWLRGNRGARIPGSISGDEFDARFDAAVQQIYDSGARNPVAFAHGGSIMLWVLMNVDNPDPALPLERPLPNIGRVVLTGSPTAGWTLTDWDGIPVVDQPTPR